MFIPEKFAKIAEVTAREHMNGHKLLQIRMFKKCKTLREALRFALRTQFLFFLMFNTKFRVVMFIMYVYNTIKL